jgi:DNA-binding MarR family transcriptional regulator
MAEGPRNLVRDLLGVALAVRRRVRRGLIERGHDLHPSHTAVIPNLPSQGLRLTELAERLGVSVQRAGQLVHALERAGYVEREVDANDARAKLVRYSARGRRLWRDADALHAEIWDELARQLGRAELGRLSTSLAELQREWVGAGAPLLLEPAAEARPRRKRLARRPRS